MVGGLRDLGFAEALAQHVARVAGAAAGAVVWGAGEQAAASPTVQGRKGRADHLVAGTRAGVLPLLKTAQKAVLIAVEKRLDASEPVS